MVSAKLATAYNALNSAGAHFVLARERGGRKPPVWAAWQKRRPTIDLILAHLDDSGLVGVIPWSLRKTGLDVDDGNPAALVETHPPFAQLRSARDGGWHLWYDDIQERRNVKFEYMGVSGDVRGGGGYLILHEGAAADLFRAFQTASPRRRLLPLDLFDLSGVTVAPSPPPAPLSAPLPDRYPDLDLRVVGVGARNVALFDAVRFWAYAQVKGNDLARWLKRVERYALRRNWDFPTPLGSEEVGDVAYSVGTWCWAGFGPIDHSPPVQMWRGRKSGRARRRRTAARDGQIVASRMVGASYAEIGRKTGLTREAVRLVVARDAPLGGQSAKLRRAWRDERIASLASAGWTQRLIAEELGVSQSTVSRSLKNRSEFDANVKRT